MCGKNTREDRNVPVHTPAKPPNQNQTQAWELEGLPRFKGLIGPVATSLAALIPPHTTTYDSNHKVPPGL